MAMPAARLGLILCALLALILAACASGTGSSAEERFAAHLDQCTVQYGFDPDATEGVGERELAPNEREWRACAYSGVETGLIPGSAVPDAYRRLIAEDQVLTDAVAAGTITRQERRARLEELFAAIAEAEAQMRDAEAARMRMVINGLRQ
jgi:ABC-type amino acid transport substrate-binding protein